jgi:DNA mismatch endonuclease (patch repair protein)
MPKTRVKFWQAKFARNVARDSQKEQELKEVGWRVLTVWECETRQPELLSHRLSEAFGLDLRDGCSEPK